MTDKHFACPAMAAILFRSAHFRNVIKVKKNHSFLNSANDGRSNIVITLWVQQNIATSVFTGSAVKGIYGKPESTTG